MACALTAEHLGSGEKDLNKLLSHLAEVDVERTVIMME